MFIFPRLKSRVQIKHTCQGEPHIYFYNMSLLKKVLQLLKLYRFQNELRMLCRVASRIIVTGKAITVIPQCSGQGWGWCQHTCFESELIVHSHSLGQIAPESVASLWFDFLLVAISRVNGPDRPQGGREDGQGQTGQVQEWRDECGPAR